MTSSSPSSSSSNSYDLLPYPNWPFAPAHPDRLHVMVRAWGGDPPALERCRVLEMGCARGGHLIPMALTLPNAEFVGIDLSAGQIAEARAMVQTLQLKNVRFVVGDLREAGHAGLGHFDYVIAHGLYSWVPPAVRTALWELSAQVLTPRGVAYVSFNTDPGWKLRSPARDVMRYAARGLSHPKAKLDEARRVLETVVGQLTSPDDPYAAALRREWNLLKGKSDGYVAHEYLEEVNDATTISQAALEAGKVGLHYWGDAGGVTGALRANQAQARQLGGADRIACEQYGDYLTGRTFRRALWSRTPFPADDASRTIGQFPVSDSVGRRVLAQSRIFRFSANALPIPIPDANANRTVWMFRDLSTGRTLHTDNAWLGRALEELAAVSPRSLSCEELLTRLAAQTPDAPFPESVQIRLLDDLWQAFQDDLTVWNAHIPPVAGFTFTVTPGEEITAVAPVASPLVRLQAATGAEVTNLRHRLATLDPDSRRLVVLLDGTRDWNALVQTRRASAPEDPHPARTLTVMLARLAHFAVFHQPTP